MTTLDDLLALLPDNTTGDIGADDLRTIVTELWNLASMAGQAFSYQWTTSPVPGVGKLNMDQGWTNVSSIVRVSETTDDGESMTFGMLDATGGQLWLQNSSGSQMRATVLGPSVDQGNYREIPIQIDYIVGTTPGNNSKITMGLFVPMNAVTTP